MAVDPTSIISVPWPITAAGTATLLAGAARLVQAVGKNRNGNGERTRLEKLEAHWQAAEPLLRQMTSSLESATRTLDMRTPLFQGLVKVVEGLNEQFIQHDAANKVQFADFSAQLEAVQKSVDQQAERRRR